MSDPVLAYVALGSNLGDRGAFLDQALALLRLQPGVSLVKVSRYHETEPVGGPSGQGKFLNAVAEVQTTLEPARLLRVLAGIETQLGRVRGERDGPRTLDLDLLLHGMEMVQTPDLVVPHPRMHERLFVLGPLVEIAPLAVHPGLQSTAKDLLDRLKTSSVTVHPSPGTPGEGRGVRAVHSSAGCAALTPNPSPGVPGEGSESSPTLQALTRVLAGQTAVVTGSTSGIGRAIARTFAQAGANVVIHGRRSREAADTVARECAQHQVRADVLMADLRDDADCVRLIEDAWKFAAIDIWVNCAGADTLTGAAADWSFERKLAELWAVDVRATMLLARSAGARMKEQGRGVILTTGWDQAESGMEGDSGQLFAASKGAVLAFTKSLAVSLAPEVRVNALAPGWIRTAWGEQASAAWQTRVLRETPLGRWGTPDDVAQTALWLASPAACFITGQVVRVNGGAVRA